MRLALVIALMAGMAVALVHIRRREISVRHEIQRLQYRQVAVRRKLWDRQMRYGRLMAPAEVRRRAAQIAPGLTE